MKFWAGNITKYCRPVFCPVLPSVKYNKESFCNSLTHFLFGKETRRIKHKKLTVHYMKHFFHREEIPLFLPEAHHYCSLVSQALQSSPQSHLFGWVPSKHNSSGQQLPLQLWAIGRLTCFYFRGESTAFQSARLTTDEAPFPPSVVMTRKMQGLCSSCEAEDEDSFGRLTPTPLSTASCWDCFGTVRTTATCALPRSYSLPQYKKKVNHDKDSDSTQKLP